MSALGRLLRNGDVAGVRGSVSARRLAAAMASLCLFAAYPTLITAPASAAATHHYLSSFGSFSEVGAVTVDQATGDVYVLDVVHGGGSLYKFNATGEPAEFSALHTNVIEGVGGLTASNLSTELAVDDSAGPASGDIYVATGEKLEIYAADGTGLGELSEAHACGVAVDPAGNVYSGENNGVSKYTPSSNPVTSADLSSKLAVEETYHGTLMSLAGATCGVAVDAGGDAYINNLSVRQERGTGEGVTARFPATQFGAHVPSGMYVDMYGGALAVDPASQDLFVDGVNGVIQYNPAGQKLGSFATSGTGAVSVSYAAGVDGQSGDVYVSNNANNTIEIFGPDVVLPDATTGDVSATSAGSVTLSGFVNPHGLAVTSCRFEYGINRAYGHTAPCSSSPGAGSTQVAVSAGISGLAVGTLYQYRLVAADANGSTAGVDRDFATPQGADACPNASIRSTQTAGYLPDCRAFEMVSPVEKGTGGANIAAAGHGESQASDSGDAIKFFSGTAFGDAQGIEAHGSEYIAQRSATGWTTHGITPKLPGLVYELFGGPQYEAFTPDLSKGVFLSYTPLTAGAPNVEHVANLYLRTDTLSAPPGNYELLSNSVGALPSQPEFPGHPEIEYVDGSADFSHLLFESDHDLTAQASALETNVPKLYEWVNGTLTLAGILPSGAPAAESLRGRGVGFSGQNSISADGSRIVFAGSEAALPSVLNLYQRTTDPAGSTTAVQLNASERSTPDPGGPQTAIFAGATPDQSKVFFFSPEMLTDGTTSGGLYRYEVDAPAGQRLTLIAPRVTAMPLGGISENGSYVYFLSTERLVPGQPQLTTEQALYVWHEGTIRIVGEHSYFDHAWDDTQSADSFRMSPDGRYAAFESRLEDNARRAGASVRVSMDKDEKCVGSTFVCLRTCFPNAACGQVFVYSYEKNSLVCASCSPTGANPLSEGTFVSQYDSEIFTNGTWYLTRAVSDNGHYVFFDTSDSLLPQDTNNQRDVYEYDTQTDEVHLISSGDCTCASTFVDASRDGSDVFFQTHQRLVRADVDSAGDLYDARVNGGIPSQNVPAAARCEGDDCQGPAKGPLVFSLPSSATFVGPGNAAASVAKALIKKSTKGKSKRKPRHKKKPSRKKPTSRHKQKSAHKRAKSTVQHVHRVGR